MYLCGYILHRVSAANHCPPATTSHTIALSGMKRSPRTNTNLEVMISSCCAYALPTINSTSTWIRECLASGHLMTERSVRQSWPDAEQKRWGSACVNVAGTALAAINNRAHRTRSRKVCRKAIVVGSNSCDFNRSNQYRQFPLIFPVSPFRRQGRTGL